MQKRGMFAVAVVAIAGGVASAQLVTSITKPLFGENDPDVFLTNVNTGQSSFLLNPDGLIPATAPGFGGLAADESNRRLFASTRNGPQDDLYRIDYDTLSPTLVGQINVNGSAISVDGLAYDSQAGQLYATKRLGTGGNAEGLYRVDKDTGAAELVLQYEAGSFDIEISAIDYDPVTGLVYLVDEDTGGGTGIWSFDPNNAGAGLSFVVGLAAGVTDVDGLGAGDGKLFLVSDGLQGNGGEHYIYNILTGQYEATLPTPYPGYSDSILGLINPSAGGAYAPGLIPTPGAGALLGLAGVAAARRRRR